MIEMESKSIDDIVCEILSIIQNLEEDAQEYAHLYLQALKAAGWQGDEDAVLSELATTDKRLGELKEE
jgi:hypothetical protein